MVLGQKLGQKPYRSIVLAEIWWRDCYINLNCIVMNFFSQTYLDAILLHAKIC